MVKLSKTSKLGCRSWSLMAVETCPQARNPDGSFVDACSGCYARSGNYRYPNVKAPREHNRLDWKRDNWVTDMVSELDNDRYFRWFDSGDMYSVALANKILEVIKLTPWVKHWIPTRMYKDPRFANVLHEINKQHNAVVRYSSDSIQGEVVASETNSTIGTLETLEENKGIDICQAYANEGKCGSCRACWDKSVKTIGYVAHGKTMLKNIEVMVA